MKRFFLLIAMVFAGAALTISCNPNSESTSNKTTADPGVKTSVINSGAYSLELTTEPKTIKANEPVKLSFTVKDSLGKPTTDLDIVHEKLMHLLVTSDDLAWFDHIHPEPQSDGKYNVEALFPSGGKYNFYADYTPKGAHQQVSRLFIDVAGEQGAPVKLAADKEDTKTFGNLRVTLKPSKPLTAEEDLMLNFKVEDANTGNPVVDLQPYLGALAHFVIISEDSTEFLHAHPMEGGGEPMKAQHHEGGAKNEDGAKLAESAVPKTGGPEVSAHTNFPKPGLYKVWAQFQRNGKVITTNFVVNVAEASPETSAVKAETENGVQKIKINVKTEGYEPSSFQLKRGIPAQITFYRADEFNCGEKLVFNELGIQRDLPVGKPVMIEFTPDKEGRYTFTCGMNMYKGMLMVTN